VGLSVLPTPAFGIDLREARLEAMLEIPDGDGERDFHGGDDWTGGDEKFDTRRTELVCDLSFIEGRRGVPEVIGAAEEMIDGASPGGFELSRVVLEADDGEAGLKSRIEDQVRPGDDHEFMGGFGFQAGDPFQNILFDGEGPAAGGFEAVEE